LREKREEERWATPRLSVQKNSQKKNVLWGGTRVRTYGPPGRRRKLGSTRNTSYRVAEKRVSGGVQPLPWRQGTSENAPNVEKGTVRKRRRLRQEYRLVPIKKKIGSSAREKRDHSRQDR